MQTIIVASQNPVKIQAVLQGFERMFPDQQFTVRGVAVPSGVKDQPDSTAEAVEGATNRANNAAKLVPTASFWVGLESGIETDSTGMQTFGWVVVRAADGSLGKSRSTTYYLAPKIAELIRQGKELGDADDIVFGQTNSKQAGGSAGLLTHGVIDRATQYTEAVILALIPFRNKALYF